MLISGSRTHSKIDIGWRDIKIFKEHTGEIVIVVLTRMNKTLGNIGCMYKFFNQGCDLHKIGPRPYDIQDLQQ